ncbi:hypothetical protein Hanom_Chr01g00016731 [Helianthus anomalus]
MNHQPLITHTLLRHPHQPSLRRLIRRKMHRGKRRIHQYRSPIRRVKRPKPLFPQHPLHTIPHPLIPPTTPQLQPLLHHIHRRKHRITHHRCTHTRTRMPNRIMITIIIIRVCESFFTEFVHGEVNSVGGTGAEAHGGDAAVEAGGAVGLEDGVNGLTEAGGFDGAGSENLHTGFNGVYWEHGHVFDHAGDGTGDHELVEVKAVVGRGDGGCWVVVWWLWDGDEVGVFEFWGFGCCHFGEIEIRDFGMRCWILC